MKIKTLASIAAGLSTALIATTHFAAPGASSEEESLKSLQNAKGAVKIVCSPGLQNIPAGLVRLIGTNNPGLKLSVESMPTKDIEPKLASGEASFALTDEPISSATSALSVKPLAVKGSLFAVNELSGPKGLSKEQAEKAAAGKIADWSELNMPKGPFRIYATEERLPKEFEPSVPEPIEDNVEAPKDAHGKPRLFKANANPYLRRFVPVSDSVKALRLIGQDPCGFAEVDLTEIAPSGVRFIEIDGVKPSQENLRAGRYHCAKVIYLVAPSKAKGPETKITALLLSPDFADELIDLGLIPAEQKAKDGAGK